MKVLRMICISLALVGGMAACTGAAPTEPTAAPSAPSFDGYCDGGHVGSSGKC